MGPAVKGGDDIVGIKAMNEMKWRFLHLKMRNKGEKLRYGQMRLDAGSEEPAVSSHDGSCFLLVCRRDLLCEIILFFALVLSMRSYLAVRNGCRKTPA